MTPGATRWTGPAGRPRPEPGYGDCGVNNIIVTGPAYIRFDLAIAKQVPIKGRVNFELRAEMLNAFNRTNLTQVTGMTNDANPNVTNADSFEVIAGESGRTIQMVFG
jgi:outer membrane receptor protein involved in Fe transport